MPIQRLSFVDSHTEGEPTRVILSLGTAAGTMQPAPSAFYTDELRRATILEPRGHDVLVGALLESSVKADYKVTFFNSSGLLGMCGHGTIGVVRTLAFLELLNPGQVTFETPVGIVGAMLHEDKSVSFTNVPSYRLLKDVQVGDVVGDVAWGGNWFFITHSSRCSLNLDHLDDLNSYAWGLRRGLASQGVTGKDGAEIDHIEICVGQKNFVLCPGGAYDRSPCGTGTSAHMACLASDGSLGEGETWKQESITGGIFEGSVSKGEGDSWIPTIRGRAFITAVGELILDDEDPFCRGIAHQSHTPGHSSN